MIWFCESHVNGEQKLFASFEKAMQFFRRQKHDDWSYPMELKDLK